MKRELVEQGLSSLRREAFRALTCLYITVESSVADDVNSKVKIYINALEKELSWIHVGDS